MALPFGVLIAIYVNEFAAPRDRASSCARRSTSSTAIPSIVIGIFVYSLLVLRFKPERVHRLDRARDHHAAADLARDPGGAEARARSRSARRARRSASPSGGRCCAWSCRRRSAASSPARRSRSPAPPARRRRSSSRRRCSPTRRRPTRSHPVTSIPFMIFVYSESPDPHLHEQAWAAAFVLIVFVLMTSLTARYLLHRGARKLAAAARPRSPAVHKPFTTPSPPFSPRRSDPRKTLARATPYLEGEKSRSMKRMLTTLVAVLARSRCVAVVGAGAKSSDDTTHRRRQHVRLAARLALGGGLRVEDRLADRLQPGRLGRGHRRDHGPPGRLRRLATRRCRRTSSTPATGCVQIPWALSATSIIYNLPGVPNNLHMTGPVLAKIYLGHDHEVGRPGDQGAEPEGQPAVDLDHARLPQRQLGDDLQLHRLPVGGQPRLEEQDRRRRQRELAGRPGRQGQLRRRRRRRRTRRARSATSTSRSRSRTS